MTADDDPGRLARVAVGETGFERAAVWSAVGFAVSYVAFDAVALAGGIAGLTSAGVVAPVAAVLAALTAVGTTAYAAVGAGALPAVLLAYGPLAAALLRTIGPTPYAIPLADPLPFAVAIAEPLGVALAAAVAVGLAGYAIGRVVAGIGGTDGETDESAGTDGSAAAANGDGEAGASD
ncbi:hypothetical protein [Halorubrum sp. Ea8]|uniref:hypothetical protein n=1 Tax=Halorubrum sp. Ea8 TaxID=1383841 RepID=UPI000B993907|nr:hypothetical protein [Halorubrum sp. Ea8]OYR43813.1 hypothetical protein DJ74_18300 [Halorubrum sp. Ea8]